MSYVGRLVLLVRDQRFRRLLVVRLVSQCADGAFQVGLAAYVLFSPQDKPDASAIAAGLAALLLPYCALGPFVGVFLDRWPRRQVLLISNVARLAPVIATAVLVAAGNRGIALFALVLVALSVNRFFLAGLGASLPHVVETDELVLANSVTPTCGTLTFMAGVGIATGLRAILPWSQPDVTIVALSAVGYLAAALLTLPIPRGLLGPDDSSGEPVQLRTALGQVARGLAAGLVHLARRRTAAAALGVVSGQRFLFGLTTVATVLLYRNYFHPHDADAALAGLATTVLLAGLGFLAAVVVTPPVARRIGQPRWIVILLLVGAVVQVAPGTLFVEWAILVAAFGTGLCAQGVKICVDTQVQLGVDDEFRGRVFAVYDVLFNALFVAAAGVAALVVPADGHSYALLIAVSAGYAALALAYASRLGHQASSRSRAASAPMSPSSSRRSSRNR